MTRAIRLDGRFRLIQQSLEELYGRDAAFAAAAAGWLMAVQYAAEYAMKRMNSYNLDGVSKAAAEEERLRIEGELEGILRSFHSRLCQQLNVDGPTVLELSKAFDQVVHDICSQGG